jgi:hypothetical protein
VHYKVFHISTPDLNHASVSKAGTTCLIETFGWASARCKKLMTKWKKKEFQLLRIEELSFKNRVQG